MWQICVKIGIRAGDSPSLYHVQMSACVSFYILISLSALRSLSPSVFLCATHNYHTYTHTQAHAQRMHAQAHAPNSTFMCVTAPDIGTGTGHMWPPRYPPVTVWGGCPWHVMNGWSGPKLATDLAGSGVFDNLSQLRQVDDDKCDKLHDNLSTNCQILIWQI